MCVIVEGLNLKLTKNFSKIVQTGYDNTISYNIMNYEPTMFYD